MLLVIYVKRSFVAVTDGISVVMHTFVVQTVSDIYLEIPVNAQ